ncbi:MAG: AIR synthase-related protein [Candidatus Helarchaeota archaeon]
MADLEGLVRRLISKNYDRDKILDKLIEEYLIYKDISKEQARELSIAVFEEVKNSLKIPCDEFIKYIIKYPTCNVTIGQQGVGCRGWGDFFVHKIIADLSKTSKTAFLAPTSLDDAGAVIYKPNNNSSEIYITSKMEGMHSRLSEFPFLAGFHVTKAALRDLYVKGSEPISILIDIHLGDDADIGKLFDFMGGVAAVSELLEVPITGGSTLRIGGDMVIGTRITGGISAIGITKKLLARRYITNNDVILMTEGAGGGTITTTAIYGGFPDVVKETMNIKSLLACKTIIKNNLLTKINCMCDVTNGGIRGDLNEIAYESKVGMNIDEEKFKALINSKVYNMLEKLDVDHLGVSLDALLIFCSEENMDEIINTVRKVGVKIQQIGHTNKDVGKITMNTKSGKTELITRYRESAYTKVKKVVGENIDENLKNKLAEKIKRLANEAMNKRNKIVEWIRKNK